MHEKEITRRIRNVCTNDQKIFEKILLKKWKCPNAENANKTMAKAETNEPQIAEAFDLEAFVQSFQYLPLDWKSHNQSAAHVKPTTHTDDSASKIDAFLAQQSRLKSKIFDELCNGDNVMRIPTLDETTIDCYWTQFAQYIGIDRKRTWRMLLMALKECLKLLQLREKLANKCNFQRRRYDELQYFFQNVSASDDGGGGGDCYRTI